MKFHQLDIFYAVAERQSITAAACDLHLSQPAVSLQVKGLEKELGVTLFERGGQRLRLTQAGEALYRCAVSIFHAKDEAERAIEELREGRSGKLILGSNTTGGMYLLPRVVRAFLEQYPDNEVVFRIDSTEWVCDNILQNVIDMALVGGPIEDRRFGVERVCIDRLALIVSPSHPFAQMRVLSPKDLENRPCIAPLQNSRTRRWVERKLREVGAGLSIALELSGTEAVKKAVEANLGFAIVSSFAVQSSDALKVVPLRGVDFSRHMELVYRRQKYFSPVARRFQEFIHSYAEQHLRGAARDRAASDDSANRARRRGSNRGAREE